MQPPGITFYFFFIYLATCVTSGKGKDELGNSTELRIQRERRLIPYMTYYVTQSQASRTNPETRNIFVPIALPRENVNVYRIHALPKSPVNPVQIVNSQQIEILPKPLAGIQNPSLFPPTIQPVKHEGGLYQRLFGGDNQYTEPAIVKPSIRTHVQTQQIQPKTQPFQVIKVNPGSIQDKYGAPRLAKLIPVIDEVATPDRTPKPFTLSSDQTAYSGLKIQAALPEPYIFNDQLYRKEPVGPHNGNPFQGNKIYAKDATLRLIESTAGVDKNKYAIAKIVLSSTTHSPYSDIEFAPVVSLNAVPVSTEHLRQSNRAPDDYRRGQVGAVAGLKSYNYAAVPPEPQRLHHAQKASGNIQHESQGLIHGQNSQLPRLRVPLEEKIRFVASVTPVPVTNDLEGAQWKVHDEAKSDKTYNDQALNGIFSLLKETNKLPQNLTPHNIDTGIKTLALILERLQQQKNYQQTLKSAPVNSPVPEHPPAAINEKDYQSPKKVESFPEKSGTSTPGRPGIDYPVYSSIPPTNFDCSTQRYKGFFGDPDTDCQVWHYCDLNGGQASFLCPNGTIFSQVALTCDWWFNVKCASTSQLYVLNERLYKYILPFSPSFPEDYSGPIVDTYLAAKFKEMEAKSKKKAGKSLTNTTTEKPEITTEIVTVESTEPTDEYQT